MLRPLDRPTLVLLLAFVLAAPMRAEIEPAQTTMPPAAPTGTVVAVSGEVELQRAIETLRSNTTIVLAPGTYVLTRTLWINDALSNIALQGATDNRDDVVIVGAGMDRASYGNVPHGIWAGGVQGVTIANLTIRDTYDSAVVLTAGTSNARLQNVRIVDSGGPLLVSAGTMNGSVEDSVFEYSTSGRDADAGGIAVRGGTNWIITDSVFHNIVAPASQVAQPAIAMSDGSSGTLVADNTFVDCARGVAFGIKDAAGSDHAGGIIRNNFFFRSAKSAGEEAISVTDSPNTEVANNTVYVSGTYGTPIEYRLPGSTNVLVVNNLLDGAIADRDGATGIERNNLEAADPGLFVDAAAGDLRLAAGATSAIDRGITLRNVTDDWSGHPRPLGTAYDIGADEYASSESTRWSAMANRAPNVTLTAPEDGATYKALATISLAATARDRETSVKKVQFFAGSTLVATDTGSPWKATWSNVAAGTYTLTAVAFDTKGLSTTSDAVTVRVTASTTTPTAPTVPTVPTNQPPSVSLLAPAAGTSYMAPATMTVSASASDADGTIGTVDFFAGSTLIGSRTAAPYSVSWANVASGSYSLTAVATDSAGATTRSAAVGIMVSTPGAASPPPPPTTTSSAIWIPPMSTTWQWQLTGKVDQSIDVAMYDIDLFDNPASVVASLKAKGRRVVCYMSAGTFEDWRPDAAQFPASVKGNSNGWPGEKWLDIRRLDILGPIMSARLDLCKQNGFDAVEPDNIDGYANKSGFPLTAQDQLAYNKWLADAAHARGLSIGLKNDLDQVKDLVSSFDWALNEQCFQYNECGLLAPFTKAGKAVFEVEYSLSTSQFCSKAVSLQFNAMKKNLDLDVPRTACGP